MNRTAIMIARQRKQVYINTIIIINQQPGHAERGERDDVIQMSAASVKLGGRLLYSVFTQDRGK